jgi:hypothetical protein
MTTNPAEPFPHPLINIQIASHRLSDLHLQTTSLKTQGFKTRGNPEIIETTSDSPKLKHLYLQKMFKRP